MSEHPTPEALEPDDHARGSETPAVTLIEYGDYDCPHTRASQAVVDRLLEANSDLRIVFRHFPLRQMHANAEILSRIAEAAASADRFWPMHDHLMHHRTAADARAVLADARDVGIDAGHLEEKLQDPAIAARVERDVHSGRRHGVHSTPSFFFNGVLHDGHYDEATLSARLNEARSRRR